MSAQCAVYAREAAMMAAEVPTDEQLMVRLGDGDDAALDDLVRRYQRDIYRFTLHYLRNPETARDIAQETFLRVYTARARFDASRKFKPWLLCIARNLCLNEIKRKRDVAVDHIEAYASASREESGVLHQAAVDGPAELLMAVERRAAVQQALALLPEDAREIVMMRYFQKMQARDIAEAIDSTEGAVRTRLHRILKQLRDHCDGIRETT